MKLSSKILQKYGRAANLFHWYYRDKRAKIPPWCKTILFSRRVEWEPFITKDFRRHPDISIEFGEITADSVGRADIVVPYELKDLLWLSSHPELTVNKKIPVPSREVVEICHNKLRFNEVLMGSGFGALVPKDRGEVAPPFIVKPNEGESSHDTFVITSLGSLERNAGLLEQPGQIRQQLIVGKFEYATHMIVRNGQLLAEMTVEYRFETQMPIKGIDDCIWQRVVKCHNAQLLLSILRKIGFEGICCFNYKVINGQIKVIELNPRFGGSLSPHFTFLLSQLE